MIKKFFAKLMGFREVARGEKTFHPREKIERELAEERRQQAMERERVRIKMQVEVKQTSPGEVVIPPNSAPKEHQE